MIEHNGVRYYPDNDRGYLSSRGPGGKGLHVAIWEEANGPVPDGHLVHHVDEDPTNNDLSNLEAVTRQEHARIHGHTVSPEAQALGREAAREWHASPAGLAWHREHAQQMVAAGRSAFTRKESLVCAWCGGSYLGARRGARPCCGAPACRSARQAEYDRARPNKGDRHRATPVRSGG